MEIATPTLNSDSLIDKHVSIDACVLMDFDKNIDSDSISLDKSVSNNLDDNLFTTFDELLKFPLLKKKVLANTNIEQSDSYKSVELKSLQSHFKHDTLHLVCGTIKPESGTYNELPTTENTSQMPLKLKASNEAEDVDDNLSFEGIKKKKRKSTKLHTENDAMEIPVSHRKVPISDQLWNSIDSDYTYDYLLSRFFATAIQKRPAMSSMVKITLKPPLVFKVGSKKTSFANFIEICRVVHRPPQHIMSFLLVELGTSGSLDGSNHLIIKGRFQQKQIENVLRRYIKEYVRCVTCNSLSTVMQKEIRLTFLMCENCESKRSVVSIKSGFQAVTGKRAVIRAKTVA